MRPRPFRALMLVALLALAAPDAAPRAMNLDLSIADIERALAIARSTERERAAFHAPYIKTVDDPSVERVEILTEFRRVVVIAEERIARGDRLFAYSSRLAGEAVSAWKKRVAVVAHLRFHPHNTYVALPEIDMSVDGPSADAAKIGVLKEPVLALPPGTPARAGERLAILGARAEGVFESPLIGQTTRTVTILIDGKPVSRVALNFAAVE